MMRFFRLSRRPAPVVIPLASIHAAERMVEEQPWCEADGEDAREQYLAQWECDLWERTERLEQREADVTAREAEVRQGWRRLFFWGAVLLVLAVVVIHAGNRVLDRPGSRTEQAMYSTAAGR